MTGLHPKPGLHRASLGQSVVSRLWPDLACSGTFEVVGCEAASSFAAQTIRSPEKAFSEIVRAAMHWHSKYTAPFPVFVTSVEPQPEELHA